GLFTEARADLVSCPRRPKQNSFELESPLSPSPLKGEGRGEGDSDELAPSPWPSPSVGRGEFVLSLRGAKLTRLSLRGAQRRSNLCLMVDIETRLLRFARNDGWVARTFFDVLR